MRRSAWLVAMVIALIPPCAAQAASPGENGKIAYLKSVPGGGREIFTVNPDGSAAVQITSGSGATVGSPDWSPDGQRLAFTGSDGEIYVVNADGAGQTRLTMNTFVEFGPSWSPDGTRIAFSRGSDVWLMDANGSNQGLLVAGRSPSWSPDGTRIAFSRSGGIYSILLDGTGLTEITTTADNANGGWFPGVGFPDWSPDGSRIVYHVTALDVEGEPCDNISSIRADGTDRMIVHDGPGCSVDRSVYDPPRWSPDGRWIVFADASIGESLVTVRPDGSGYNHVGVSGTNPDWQPIPINAYARPKGATPSRFSLVPAYLPCSAPNRTHGPPLAFGSCNPPAKNSPHLTVPTPETNGAQGNFQGSVRTTVVLGNPATPADEADVSVTVSGSDVRCDDTDPPTTCGAPNNTTTGSLSGIPDYTGELEAVLFLRITDKENTPNPGGPGAATVEDFDLRFGVPCTGTASTSAGSVCATTTSVDTLVPGAVKEGKRAIWELDRVHVRDGGSDGDADTTGNRVFLRPGVFVP